MLEEKQKRWLLEETDATNCAIRQQHFGLIFVHLETEPYGCV